MKGSIRFIYLILLILTMSLSLPAQNSFGQANVNAPEMEKLAYLTGDWEVTSYFRGEDSTFSPNPHKSYFKAYYLYDGYMLQTEYYGDDPNGFYSTTLIRWDDSTATYHCHFFNAKKNRTVLFLGRLSGEVLEVTNRGGYAAKEDYIYRESDTRLSDDHFLKHLHRSDDNGKSWHQLNYYFEFRRKKSAR